MRSILSKSVLAAVVLTTSALITHTAKAETSVQVPFSFTVAGGSMPAGLYTVSHDTYHNLVVLKSKGTTKSFSAVLVPGDADNNETHIALKFAQSGNAHTLETIQYGSRTTTRLDRVRESRYDAGRLSMGR